jgi:hypothetical protein
LIAPLLPLGALATFWHTPVHAAPALVSLFLGSALLWRSARRRDREPVSLARAKD